MQLRQQESIRKENLGTTICHFIVFAHVNFCGVVSGPPCDQGPPGPLSQHECGSSLWDPRLAKLGRFLPVTFLGCPEPLFHAAHAPQGLSAVVLGFFEKEKKCAKENMLQPFLDHKSCGENKWDCLSCWSPQLSLFTPSHSVFSDITFCKLTICVIPPLVSGLNSYWFVSALCILGLGALVLADMFGIFSPKLTFAF